LFESFRIRELAEQAGSDAFLKRLLLRHLPATLESSQKNLSYALNQLRKMLVRMREDQRLSRMVGAFEAHFINNRGFEPSIDHLDLRYVPEFLNTVEPFQIKGFGDIYDSADDLELIEIAAKARTIPVEIEDKPVPDDVATVNFDVAGETEVEEDDPVEEAIEELIQMVVDGALGERSILASEALTSTCLKIDKADWLQAIVSEIESLSDGDQQYIEVIYHQVPHRIYPDNVMVSDLTLRHSNAG